MKVLRNVGGDRDHWLDAWERCGREPFAHPDYVALFASKGEMPIAVLLEQGEHCILLPLVRRSLPSAAAATVGDAWSDVVSPYGFGGPYADGVADWPAFYRELLDWMREERVLTGFIRSDPGHPAQVSDVEGLEIAELNDMVEVDLTRAEDEQWLHYAHKVRKNVKKASRAGLQCRISEGFVDLEAFMSVYTSTMDRRGAAERYYFDRDFFERLGSLKGSVMVADVLDGERVISTELVLRSAERLYSFLGGTLAEAYPLSPNDLLKHEVIGFGRLSRLRSYVLGGGYEPGDGIFRYKRGFDSAGVVPFRGVRLAADVERYRAASSASASPGFFPAYRAPLDGDA